MKIAFHTKKCKLTNLDKHTIQEKLDILRKYKGTIPELLVNVDISQDQHHKKGDIYEVEIRVRGYKKVLNSKGRGPEIISAFDSLIDKIVRQARDAKDRQNTKQKRTH